MCLHWSGKSPLFPSCIINNVSPNSSGRSILNWYSSLFPKMRLHWCGMSPLFHMSFHLDLGCHGNFPGVSPLTFNVLLILPACQPWLETSPLFPSYVYSDLSCSLNSLGVPTLTLDVSLCPLCLTSHLWCLPSSSGMSTLLVGCLLCSACLTALICGVSLLHLMCLH